MATRSRRPFVRWPLRFPLLKAADVVEERGDFVRAQRGWRCVLPNGSNEREKRTATFTASETEPTTA